MKVNAPIFCSLVLIILLLVNGCADVDNQSPSTAITSTNPNINASNSIKESQIPPNPSTVIEKSNLPVKDEFKTEIHNMGVLDHFFDTYPTYSFTGYVIKVFCADHNTIIQFKDNQTLVLNGIHAIPPKKVLITGQKDDNENFMSGDIKIQPLE